MEVSALPQSTSKIYVHMYYELMHVYTHLRIQKELAVL